MQMLSFSLYAVHLSNCLRRFLRLTSISKMIGIKKNRDFSRVYRRGTSKADQLLVLYVFDRGDGEPSRFGVSVSKKTGNSVIRHRIKRRLKEIYRLNEDAFGKGYDFVVIGRKGAASAAYPELERSLKRLMIKLCLRNG